MVEHLIQSTSDISLAYLRILLILYSIHVKFVIKRKLWILPGNYFVCDEEVMQHDTIITYGYLVQEAMYKYRNIVDSKRWESTDNNKKSQDEPLILKASTVEIGYPFKNTTNQVGLKSSIVGKTTTMV